MRRCGAARCLEQGETGQSVLRQPGEADVDQRHDDLTPVPLVRGALAVACSADLVCLVGRVPGHIVFFAGRVVTNQEIAREPGGRSSVGTTAR